jgi:hypothetical protein
MSDFRRRYDRVQRARAIARGEIAIGIAWILISSLLWTAAPGHSGSMFRGSAPTAADIAVGAIAVQVVALAVMIRIYRATPEPGDPTWRFLDY